MFVAARWRASARRTSARSCSIAMFCRTTVSYMPAIWSTASVSSVLAIWYSRMAASRSRTRSLSPFTSS